MSKDITNTLKAKLVTANGKLVEMAKQLDYTSARLDKAKGAISGLRVGGQELKDILDERNKELIEIKKRLLVVSGQAKVLQARLFEVQETADIRRDALTLAYKRLGVTTVVSITAVAFAALAVISIFLGA